MRFALLPTYRMVNRGGRGFRLERLPRFTIDLGFLIWLDAFGLRVGWGIRSTNQVGEAWQRRSVLIVHFGYDRIIDWPWLWWSPIRPISRRVRHKAVAWTGRDREVVGVAIDVPWRRYGTRHMIWG